MKSQMVVLHDQQDKALRMIPKPFVPILSTTPDSLLEKVEQYQPEICIILATLLTDEPWTWLDKLDEKVSTVIVRTTTKEDFRLYELFQKWFKSIVVIPPLLTEGEIQQYITSIVTGELLTEEAAGTQQSITRAFVGTGGTGITTFFLLAAPLYSELNPDKKILLVDMNEDKRDLSVALSAQPAQLSLWQAHLARGSEEFSPIAVKHPGVPQISVISASKPWGSQEISTFLKVARLQYDEIWFDVSRPYHVPRLLEEIDEVVYVVRPDFHCLGGMKRIASNEWSHKAKLLVSQYDDRFASTKEIQNFLGIDTMMGAVPFEHPLLPLKIVKGQLPLSKKMKKALQKMNWETTPTKQRSIFRSWIEGLMK